MHTIKITPNYLNSVKAYKRQIYQIAESNRKIDSVARIESKLFCLKWNALIGAEVSQVRTVLGPMCL